VAVDGLRPQRHTRRIMDDGAFSDDSLEGDYFSADDDASNPELGSEEEEHEMMLDDLRAVWEQSKGGGGDLADVLNHMVEVSSRPGTGYYSRPGTGARPSTGRLGPPQPLTPEAGRLDVSFLQDIDDVLAVRPATSSGRDPTTDARPTSSLGRVAEQHPMSQQLLQQRGPTGAVLRRDSAQARPRTPFDSDTRVACMQKVTLTTRVVETRAYTPRPGSAIRAVTPRGINALYNKRVDSSSRPTTPFTSDETKEQPVTHRPTSTAGNRRRDVATSGTDLASVREEVLDTDNLPDAKGTETHNSGVDVWTRDDEDDVLDQPTESLLEEIIEGMHEDITPHAGSTPRSSMPDRVVPTAEPGGGTCVVGNSTLVDWMNNSVCGTPPPVNDPADAYSDEDEDNSCQFASEAARLMLLGPTSPAASPVSAAAVESALKAPDRLLSSRANVSSREGNTKSRESKRAFPRRDSVGLQLDCTPKTPNKPPSSGSSRENGRSNQASAHGSQANAHGSRPASKAGRAESRPTSSGLLDAPLSTLDAQNRMRVTREIAAYNAQPREKTPSVTLAGRDIGGEIKVRAQEIEAQEKAARRDRELVSNRLLSTSS